MSFPVFGYRAGYLNMECNVRGLLEIFVCMLLSVIAFSVTMMKTTGLVSQLILDFWKNVVTASAETTESFDTTKRDALCCFR